MALSLFQRIFQQMLQRFTANMGRGPGSPFEWNEIQSATVRHINKTKGVPEKTTKDPFKGWKPEMVEEKVKKAEIIDFPKKGITSLLKSGEVKVGKAPKTQKSTLDAKKEVLDKQISKEMRIKEIQRENKEAIERFKKKMKKDPDKFQYGGIAPLVGEPTYAANFYDDRTPYAKGKKAKKKKQTVAELKKELVEDLIKQGVATEEIIKLLRGLPAPFERLPHGKQRYREKSDLPEGILELLEKDPGFDFENFQDAYWAGEGWRHTDPGWNEGQRGSYSPMTGAIELNMAPFGKKEYTKYRTHSPHLPDRFLTDTDKAKITGHELRHKNIMEDRELFMTQPEWVQRQKGPGYLPQGGVTGHELYNRFLDQRYYPPEEDPGPNDPYFDTILKDYWDPNAQDYEKTAKRRLSERKGEGIEVLANQGGRIGMAGGGPLFKFIERLFIKASNDIRLGKGKWKGLDQKQRIVQHDNLTKKAT